MTARFRSAFSGSSGFVAVGPQARVIPVVQDAAKRKQRADARPHAVPACLPRAEAA